ncbi:MAG: inorganic phosphate transporter [Candidatus Neomarinimicrobiota bacterium]
MIALLFLSSGLFLGWSLGANDASNIFGTAIGTRMVRFKTAAIIASIFVILGAVISGSGPSQTLGRLGEVTAVAGAFSVALSAGLTVLWMTRTKLPVSTSQAIIGGIISWSIFAQVEPEWSILIKIVFSWFLSIILAAIFALILYHLIGKLVAIIRVHLFRIDLYTRLGLIAVGAFGAYTLGANNIANVVGVFVPSTELSNLVIFGLSVSAAQQLFFIGSLAIALGIITYSKRVIETIGKNVIKMTPQAAFVAVLAASLVLFLFTSRSLESFLLSRNLPSIPLVPISSSQVIIGSLVGIGFAHGGRGLQAGPLLRILGGWITTPIIAALMTYGVLFLMDNVFGQSVG